MRTTRRELLAACAAALPALAASPVTAGEDRGPGELGLVIHSFAVRGAADRGRPAAERLADPVRFLDYCRTLGVRCVQVGLGARDDAYADALRARAAGASMALEGIVAPPRDEADLGRFEAEIRTAARAGAAIVRTVTSPGRRYEAFDTAAAFRRFADHAFHALSLAAPILVRHGVRLAVENHKDWRSDELLALLDRLGCDHVGVCLDTGNSMALLEDPMATVEALAPRAITTHFKDMAVEESAQGFRLAEVPLGLGVIDLPRIVGILRAARPAIRFNIEMITRDPLEVPCLADRYWAALPDLPGRDLARALSFVRAHPPGRPLPRIGPLGPGERLRAEDDNIRRCLDHARDRLGLR